YDFNDIGARLDGANQDNAFRQLADASFSNWTSGLQGNVPFGYHDSTGKARFEKMRAARALSQDGDALLYHRLRYSGDPRLFTDLLPYAPGLNTSETDIRAVLDAEPRPQLSQAPGRIDPEASKLIEASRKAVWNKLTLGGEKGQPEQVIFFDGAGRYRY